MSCVFFFGVGVTFSVGTIGYFLLLGLCVRGGWCGMEY